MKKQSNKRKPINEKTSPKKIGLTTTPYKYLNNGVSKSTMLLKLTKKLI